jgi:hypothetical protein
MLAVLRILTQPPLANDGHYLPGPTAGRAILRRFKVRCPPVRWFGVNCSMLVVLPKSYDLLQQMLRLLLRPHLQNHAVLATLLRCCDSQGDLYLHRFKVQYSTVRCFDLGCSSKRLRPPPEMLRPLLRPQPAKSLSFADIVTMLRPPRNPQGARAIAVLVLTFTSCNPCNPCN